MYGCSRFFTKLREKTRPIQKAKKIKDMNLLPPKRSFQKALSLSSAKSINGTVESVIATPVGVLGFVSNRDDNVSITNIRKLCQVLDLEFRN